jgi:hypothetical protein
MILDRREFTTRSLLALFSGVTVTLSGCGGGGGSSPGGPSSNPSPQSGDKVGDITANHGHRAVINAAQLSAGGDILLDIGTSASTHSHTVSLTGAEVVSIRNGTRVSKRSSNTEAHDHTVTFN